MLVLAVCFEPNIPVDAAKPLISLPSTTPVMVGDSEIVINMHIKIK